VAPQSRKYTAGVELDEFRANVRSSVLAVRAVEAPCPWRRPCGAVVRARRSWALRRHGRAIGHDVGQVGEAEGQPRGLVQRRGDESVGEPLPARPRSGSGPSRKERPRFRIPAPTTIEAAKSVIHHVAASLPADSGAVRLVTDVLQPIDGGVPEHVWSTASVGLAAPPDPRGKPDWVDTPPSKRCSADPRRQAPAPPRSPTHALLLP
jgi:hypothetical protein